MQRRRTFLRRRRQSCPLAPPDDAVRRARRQPRHRFHRLTFVVNVLRNYSRMVTFHVCSARAVSTKSDEYLIVVAEMLVPSSACFNSRDTRYPSVSLPSAIARIKAAAAPRFIEWPVKPRIPGVPRHNSANRSVVTSVSRSKGASSRNKLAISPTRSPRKTAQRDGTNGFALRCFGDVPQSTITSASSTRTKCADVSTCTSPHREADFQHTSAASLKRPVRLLAQPNSCSFDMGTACERGTAAHSPWWRRSRRDCGSGSSFGRGMRMVGPKKLTKLTSRCSTSQNIWIGF